VVNTKLLAFVNAPNTTGSGTRKTLFVDLPFALLEASGDKYIFIRHVKALALGGIPSDVKMHSSIVSLAPFDDSFACFCHETLVKPKKFQYHSSNKTLSFWFKNLLGEEVIIDSFVIELLLEWAT
jgi:hypothetical protein